MSQSPKPTPKVKTTIAFPEAITEILKGKSVTKQEWADNGYYGFLENERLRLHKPDGQSYDWIVSEGDMRGDDYVIL